VLLPKDRGSIATKDISYGVYDRGGVLLSGEHYKREPQGAFTGGQRKYYHWGYAVRRKP